MGVCRIMRKIILIGGDLASGKSTYSEILAKKYSLPLFNKDVFKETLGDVIETNTREENKKLSLLSFKMLMYIARENVSPMIFESNFKDYEIEELEPLLIEHGYDILSLRLQGKDEVVHKRFLERINSGTRHKVHQSQDLTRLEDYVAVVNDLRKVVYPGKVINIDATTFDYQKDENLFKEIEEFLNK